MKYFEEAQALWRTYVPQRGQAETVQGELIRAVEKLRDEAQRNGNANWSDDHETLAQFVRSALTSASSFSSAERAEINADVDRVLDFERPEISDEPYDRLTDRVVEWARANPTPIPRPHNSTLRI